MKKTSFKKYGYLFMATLTLASAAAGAIGGLTASVSADTPSNVVVGDIIGNKTSARSVTIHKYKVDDLSKVLDRGTGEIDPDKIAGYDPLPNAKFSIKKVKQLGTKPLTNWRDVVEGTDWDYDTTGPTIEEKVTDADGKLTFDLSPEGADKSTNDGIYLVTETETPVEGKVTYSNADPFFVYIPQTYRGVGTDDAGRGLIYDVNVYPKNIMNTDLQPEKSIVTPDNADGTSGGSVDAGAKFQWYGSITVPSGLYYQAAQDSIVDYYNDKGEIAESKPVAKDAWIHAQHLKLIDDIDTLLTFSQADSKVEYLAGDGTWKELVENTDYTWNQEAVTEPAAANRVTMSLEEKGMETVVTGKGTKIRVTYTTNAAIGFNGEITNKLNVDYLTPGAKPKKDETPDIPKYSTGGFEIFKKDEANNKLTGAEFKLVRLTPTEAADPDVKSIVHTKVTNGEFAKDGAGAEYVATSDAEGVATFNGLGLDVNGSGEVQDTVYYLVETKSPEGFDKLAAPVEIKVNAKTSNTGYTLKEDGTKDPNPEAFEAEVINVKKTELPFTGGQGTTILIVVAMGAISIGTAAVVIDKKRRQA